MHPGLFLAAMSVLVLLAGLGTIYVGRKNQRLALASALWPQTTGTITALNIAEIERTANDNEYMVFRPEVAYAYAVEGRTYTGDRIAFGDQTKGSRNDAQKLLAPYQVGGPVQVFYDPADPQAATLTTKAAGATSARVFGVLLALAGLGGVVGGFYLAATVPA
jgi:uncharacterized protein DUF3592